MIKLPKKIKLTATNELWKVSYIKTPGKLFIVEYPHHELVIHGRHYSKQEAMCLIVKWIRRKARHHLVTLLERLNRKVKVNYKKIVIRPYETQWGSYSSSKTIALNYRLIFLPPSLVNYVIIHELCHVRYFSHSEKFWAEVEKYNKTWKKNIKALQEANSYLPNWLHF